ncbi:undecaprenyl-diphosphate phosphatase [Ideonella azotifigens]|uniref:Undecaprenyl-diphosphatase n=1 Tax=Ideonella azotifigens TaxID=513160 RepID=A0ABN1KD93_9BURK|nr:undecaprenyl-diphosphate phosphatase [Ideonella azotifigens]MCD2343658.1 undecaprenyl-diphosphate phosphatase [Ideonella azotifigens]
MDWLLLLKAAVMGVVEGLTEFLPVSSTGHLILAGSVLGFEGGSLTPEKVKAFEISIQTGAILAIVLVYWQRLSAVVRGLGTERNARRFALNVLIGFLPAVVFGLLIGKKVQELLFTPLIVAATFIIGGFIILWAERRKNVVIRVAEVEDMTPWDALKIGLVQCLAFVPGTSRSGSTIIGGMLFGLSRKAATEFTFFLAIPTLIGAGAYSLLKVRHSLVAADLPLFAVGFVFSFIAAWACVRWLLRYVSTHNFNAFAWYRIGFGLLILITAYTGVVSWTDS